MSLILNAIIPILFFLAAGLLSGYFCPTPVRQFIAKLITPLVWLLLFSIGCEFYTVLGSTNSVLNVVWVALLFASLTTFFPCIIILLFVKQRKLIDSTKTAKRDSSQMLGIVRECSIAFLMVISGVLTMKYGLGNTFEGITLPTTTMLLYALILLVGVDLAGIKFSSSWLSIEIITIPFLVILGSFIGGVVASFLTEQPIKISLALSSGFGWFSLSGALIGKHLGDSYGAIALLTDLFRELIAIALLYSVAARYPSVCIGASGATALDSTYPS